MKSIHILFVLLFLGFAGWLHAQPEINAQAQGDVIDRIVGVVGNEIILLSDIESSLVQQRMQGNDPDGNSRCEIIDNLLFEKLLLNQAKIDSLVVTEGEIQSMIEDRLNYFLSLFGSIEAMEKEYGKTIAEWKAEFHDPIKDQLLIQQMQGQLNLQSEATPRDVQRFVEGLHPDSIPLVSEEVRYSQIIFQPEPSTVEKEALRQKADSVRKLVESGKLTLAIAALRHSDDPGSKYKGGCYENIPKGAFVPEFESAVYNTPIGDLTPVFESDFGYHFVKVTDKKAGGFSACHVLFSPKVNDEDLIRSERFLDSLAQIIRDDSLSFERAAVLHSTDKQSRMQEGKVANMYTGGMKHAVDQLERDIFLVLNKLEVGEVSAPVMREDPGKGPYFVVFRVDGRSAAHKANLRDDYLMFKSMAEGEMQQASLEKWITKKLKDTYVRLSDDYSNCTFTFPWTGEDL